MGRDKRLDKTCDLGSEGQDEFMKCKVNNNPHI